jgi:hypothetical protein
VLPLPRTLRHMRERKWDVSAVCVLLLGGIVIRPPWAPSKPTTRVGRYHTSLICLLLYRSSSRHHGLPQVGSRLDCKRPSLPVHLWRTSRHRSINLDSAQWHQEGMSDRNLLSKVSAADTTSGRQLEMQHLLLRYQRQPLSPAFGTECS